MLPFLKNDIYLKKVKLKNRLISVLLEEMR